MTELGIHVWCQRVSVSTPFKRYAAAYVRWSVRFRVWVLALAGVLSVLALLGASRVRIDPRIEALLPSDVPSIVALEEMRQRLPAATPPLYLLVQSSDPELNRALVQQMQAAVREWPETRWTMQRRDPSVFLDHRLLYLPLADLEEFTEQVEERVRWEECERVPGCANLDDEAPPLPTDEELRAALERNPDIRALVSLFGADTEAFVEAQAAPRAGDAGAVGGDANQPASGSTLGELCSPDGRVCSLIVALDGDADDLDFATQILERSEALFEQLRPEQAPDDLKMAVSGQYRNLPMTRRSVDTDLSQTTLLSVALIALVLATQFRTFQSFIVVLLPVLMGILWTAGALGALRVELNVISSFTLAVLAGVGIDFGIHLLTHYSERREQTDPERALMETFESLGPALLVAASTTAFGFAILSVASFRGFSQMGPIAAAGIAACLFSFLLLLPALVLSFERKERAPFVLRRFRSPPWERLRKRARPVAALGVVLGVAALLVAPRIGFEYDTRKLQPKTVSHGIDWTKTMHGTTRTAVYMLADNPAALHAAAQQLRAEPPLEVVEPERPFLLVPASFLPEQQGEKLALVERLRASVERAEARAGAEARQRIQDFKGLVQIDEPLTQEKMPRWVRDWLVENDGSFGTFGILYTKLSGANARHMELLAQYQARWQAQFEGVRFASPVSALGEVTPRLRQEAPFIAALALCGVFLSALATVRSPRRALFVMSPLLMMAVVSLAAMVLLGWRLNLYNMLVFPLAFGMGIDGAVYIAWATRQETRLEALTVAARGVVGSTLTTIAGFAALMRSVNPGLVSIGQLAMLTLGIALVFNLVWLPALQWAVRRRPRHPNEHAAS